MENNQVLNLEIGKIETQAVDETTLSKELEMKKIEIKNDWNRPIIPKNIERLKKLSRFREIFGFQPPVENNKLDFYNFVLELSCKDPDFMVIGDSCKYLGTQCELKEYVLVKYGEEAMELIESLV